MSRIKGKWVGQVIITVDCERTRGMLPIETIKENAHGMKQAIKDTLGGYDIPDLGGTIEVDEQYCDFYEVLDEGDAE